MVIEFVGAGGAEFVGAWSPDQPRDDAGRWTDGGDPALAQAGVRALAAHPDAALAAHGYRANPLAQEGGPSDKAAWTGAKERVESALLKEGAFSALLAQGTEETVAIDSLRSYQTWTNGHSLEHHLQDGANGRGYHDWRDKPAGVVYRHEGTDWVIDGNNRLAVLKLGGASKARVVRIGAKASVRAAFDPEQPRDESGRWTTSLQGTKSNRLIYTAKGGDQRIFIDAKLKAKYRTFLDLEDDIIGSFTVDKGFDDSAAYLNRLDVTKTGQGYGSEILGHVLSHLKTSGVRTVKAYVENVNIASQSMLRKIGFTRDETTKHGAYYLKTLESTEFIGAAEDFIDYEPSRDPDDWFRAPGMPLTMIGAWDPDQPRDESGKWTSAGSLFDAPDTMVHGSPKHLDELQGGSMFSNDPLWAAGYTTKSDWAGRESFVGGIHSFDLPKDAKTISTRSVHAAEDKLIKMATDLKDGKTVTSLSEAAKLVSKHDPDLVAIISKDRNNVVNGGILIRPSKVTATYDPVAVLKEGRQRGRELPGNLDIALRGAASPSRYRLSKFAAQHAAELVDAPKRTRDAIRSEVRKALKNGEGPDGIADRLFEVVDKTPSEIQRIAETEYVIARTGARLEQLDANGADGKEWTLGPGEDGCPICQALDGTVVALGEMFEFEGEEFDGPPAHPFCKCDVKEADAALLKAAEVVFVGAYDPEQPRDEQGQWTDGAGYAKDGAISQSGLEQRFPKAGKEVNGFVVTKGPVPNTDSIAASLDSYEVLPGIREVRMSDFGDTAKPKFYSSSEQERTEQLAERIKDSKEIAPLIVVIDKEKSPYILEGGHRFDALKLNDVESFPALVVIDTSELELKD
jgi:RimJ/RimL family protein N-acetyltransferase